MSTQQFLNFKNVVDITSQGVSDAFTLGRFNTLAIKMRDTANPLNELTTYTSAQAVLSAFGVSPTYSWAREYFGFTSKTATKPEKLHIYEWSKTDTPPVLIGAKALPISELKKLNGGFSITIGGHKEEVTLNLTGGGIVSYENVATSIQTALQAKQDLNFKTATCSYSYITGGFIITGGQAGANIAITGAGTPTSGTDISNKGLGIAEADAVKIQLGRKGYATLAEVLERIDAINGDYYTVTPLFKFDNEATDIATFGKFSHDSEGRFLCSYLWDSETLKNTSDATKDLKGFDGLYIDYKCYPEQGAYSCGMIASLAFNKRGGNFNLNFNPNVGNLESSITDQIEFENLNNNRANMIYTIGQIGQYSTLYGQGQIMGGLTSSANVYIVNSYFKMQMQFAVGNLLTSSGFIALRGNEGRVKIEGALSGVFADALDRGLIVRDTLTDTEKNKILEVFRDGENSIEAIQNNGFAVEFGDVATNTKTMSVNVAYLANTPLVRVVVSTYILGA